MITGIVLEGGRRSRVRFTIRVIVITFKLWLAGAIRMRAREKNPNATISSPFLVVHLFQSEHSLPVIVQRNRRVTRGLPRPQNTVVCSPEGALHRGKSRGDRKPLLSPRRTEE
ncbi:hypothetical protein J5N97_024582 [Dioscorea zingiberensis]|uniref:Uncharacterized protein n=1 Tax=Dioscorea zingiberensis TaxID=325984 RepID=A0A9D5H929_9LILI|nr:hypothetical protein J5N97_024582 [Dioscorea zingiberensis]